LLDSLTYYENVSIPENKITLQGEDANTTTIHGKWTAEKVVYVTGNYVNVSGFTVAGSTLYGYEIYVNGDNCNISDNGIAEGGWGIYLSDSDNSIVSRNNISVEHINGIVLLRCRDCLVEDNNANLNDNSISLRSSNNNTITNNIANSYGTCISLDSSSNNTITNNIVNSNYPKKYYGISLDRSCNNLIADNDIANLDYYCIGLDDHSSNNLIADNNIANSYWGIYSSASSNNNTLTNNNASNNEYGIYSLYSSNNTINNNSINNNLPDLNSYGICLLSTSTNNIITENTITNNEYGMYLYYSGNNEIYHNNFINNNKQAYDHHGFNDWDKGQIIGGNYWSDHNCTGNPSNGTEPYTKIDTNAGAVDNYPFEDPDGWVKVEEVFDTGYGTYPSIMGNHTGIIKPNYTVIATKLYTYPCEGTGGHTEYARIWNKTWNATATWDGYQGDWHNITFDKTVVLLANETYNYTLRTGSYPQIIHEPTWNAAGGTITCTIFTDANGRTYTNWIPAFGYPKTTR